MTGRIRVDLGLPLPVDVVSTIGNLIDAAYPGTVIDATAGPGVMRLLLPEGARKAKRVSKTAVKNATAEPADDPMDVHGWEPTDDGVQVAVSAPEALTRLMLPLVQAALDDTDGAVNYVEQAVSETSPPYRRFVVIACRSEGQTPHALRTRAEAERDAALVLADSLLTAHGQVGMDTPADQELHNQAMTEFRRLRDALRPRDEQ